MVAVTRPVDQRLRMFDTKANREWFRFDIHATVVQHLKRVPRAVTNREHDMIGRNSFAVFKYDAARSAALDCNVGNLALETKFTAERLYRFAHRLHHAHQPEGADV